MVMTVTKEELEEIVKELVQFERRSNPPLSKNDVHLIVTETVRQTLIQLGVDASNPMEMQKDFQHLRNWRQAGQSIQSKGILAIVAVLASGIVGFIIVGFKDWISK